MNAEVFWLRYRREIVALVVLLVVLAAAWGIYQIYADRREAAAAALLASAKSPPDYEKVIAQYAGTPAGGSAHLLLADAQHKEKKFAESNTTLQRFIDKNPGSELLPTARIAMGANLEAMGKVDEAVSLYQQLAQKYPKSYAAPLALMAEVPLLKSKNQPDAARRVCETVLSQYGESFWAGEAMRELRSLKPAPGVAPAGRLGVMPGPSTAPSQGAGRPPASPQASTPPPQPK